MTRRQKEMLLNQITNAGSILVVTKQLQQKQDNLNSEIKQLTQKRESYLNTIREQEHKEIELRNLTTEGIIDSGKLDIKNKEKRWRLTQLIQQISKKIHDLYISHLIIDFLLNSDRINDDDLDHLVDFMITIREDRIGIKSKQASGRTGLTIRNYDAPKIYTTFNTQKVNIDQVKEAFAFLLTPLLGGKLVSKYEYELARAGWEVIRGGNVTTYRPIKSPRSANPNLPPVFIVQSNNP